MVIFGPLLEKKMGYLKNLAIFNSIIWSLGCRPLPHDGSCACVEDVMRLKGFKFFVGSPMRGFVNKDNNNPFSETI